MAYNTRQRTPKKSSVKKKIDMLKQPGKMTGFVMMSLAVVILFVLGIANPIPSNDHTFDEAVFFPSGSLSKEPFEMDYRYLKQFPDELAVLQDKFVNVPSQAMWSDRGISLYRTFGQVILAVCDTGNAKQEDVRKVVVSNVLGGTYADGKEHIDLSDTGYFGNYDAGYYAGTYTPKGKEEAERGYMLGYTITQGDSTLAVYAVTKGATSDLLKDMRSLTADCVSTIHNMGQEPVKEETGKTDKKEITTSSADGYGIVENITDEVLLGSAKEDKLNIIKRNDELDEIEQVEYIRYKNVPDELKDSDPYNYTCQIDDGYKELTVTAKLSWASADFDTDKVYLRSPDGGYYNPNPSDSDIGSDEGKFVWHLHSPEGGTWYIKTNKKLTGSDIKLDEAMDD